MQAFDVYEKLDCLYNDGFRIIYCDELMFTVGTMQK